MNNPYEIQVKKRMKLILINALVGFIPGMLVLFFFIWFFNITSGQSTLSLTSFKLIVFGALLLPVIVFYLISLLIQLIYNYLYLSSLNYSTAGKNFLFAGGILSKFEKNLPYSKIQHIIIYESFWQRIFGICSVAIETAGSGGFNMTQFSQSNQNIPVSTGPLIPDLKKEDAEKLKNEIISKSKNYKPSAGV